MREKVFCINVVNGFINVSEPGPCFSLTRWFRGTVVDIGLCTDTLSLRGLFYTIGVIEFDATIRPVYEEHISER